MNIHGMWTRHGLKCLMGAALLALGAGCGAGDAMPCTQGSGVVVMCPQTIAAGGHAELFGAFLGGDVPSSTITFKDANGASKKARPNFGDDQSIDVTVPQGLASGPVTITVYNGECNVTCTTVLK